MSAPVQASEASPVRAAAICGAVGVLALLIGVILAGFGAAVMPSYLAAWLFWIGLPLGTLPVLMTMELVGGEAGLLAPALRRLLTPLPVLALLVVPVLARMAALYPWHAVPPAGFGGSWYSPGFFAVRAVLFLLIWTALGLVFSRPPRPGAPRQGLAALGLVLHIVVGTLAASDWAMSVDPALHSSEFGLLLIAAQCSLALAAAALLAARATPVLPGWIGGLLLASLATWFALQFLQFLVIWSGNLPGEIGWYLSRDRGWGRGAEWFGVFALVVPGLVLLPGRLSRRAGVVGAVAGMVLCLHAVEALWLVTPHFAGRFRIAVPDLTALVGVGGLALAALLVLGRGREARA